MIAIHSFGINKKALGNGCIVNWSVHPAYGTPKQPVPKQLD